MTEAFQRYLDLEPTTGSPRVVLVAGIPGTGISYRSKIGKSGSAWIGIVTLVVGLGFAAYKNIDKIGALFGPSPAAVTQQASPAQPATTAAPAAGGERTHAAAAPKPTSIRAQAVKLLGAQVVITGIRPEVAQTLVGLGLELNGIVTRATLQSGISLALGKQAQAR